MPNNICRRKIFPEYCTRSLRDKIDENDIKNLLCTKFKYVYMTRKEILWRKLMEIFSKMYTEKFLRVEIHTQN